MTKISSEHLARGAYVYVRQSTADQLRNNHESRRRQYSLAERTGRGSSERHRQVLRQPANSAMREDVARPKAACATPRPRATPFRTVKIYD